VLGGRAHDYDAALAYASLKDVVASVPLDQLDPPTAAALDELVVAADGAVRRAPRSDVVPSSGGACTPWSPNGSAPSAARAERMSTTSPSSLSPRLPPLARRSSCDCGDRAGPVRWGWRAHLLV